MVRKKEDIAKEIIEETEVETIEEVFMEDDEIMQKSGTDLVFEDGPTFDELAEWKSRYNGDIFASEFDIPYVWRPLRRNEYKSLQRTQGQDEFYQEEAICRTCVLWPKNYADQKMAFGKAGIPSMLSQLILEQSGFVRPGIVRL